VAKRAENRTPTPLPVAEPYRPEQNQQKDKTPAPIAASDEVPSLKPRGFLSGLFTRKKKPVAAIAAKAGKMEFTERVPKMAAGSLYSGEERHTELAFPAPEVIRKQRAAANAAAARKKQPVKKQPSPSPQMESPARFCDRCWRRLDATGICKTCPTI
jgi:hypothetical protein